MSPDAVSSRPALLVRLRPVTPWRLGPDSGARDRVDAICHSDTLYSALTWAMGQLGCREEWLEATAGRDGPSAVACSSLFPLLGDLRLVTPPRHLWPPHPSSKVRWKGARFVPLSVVERLAAGGALSEDDWIVDGGSGCLLPAASRAGLRAPFRITHRPAAAVDRLTAASIEPHWTACLEFHEDAGLWGLAAFADQDAAARWRGNVEAAFRLLADSGIGGERSRGWGRSAQPELEAVSVPESILAHPRETSTPGESDEPQPDYAWWLLSLFSPAPGDQIDWRRGNYSLVSRAGRVESGAAWGALKPPGRLLAEGSVIFCGAPPVGAAANVAPAGLSHPVYRAGFAVAVPVPYRGAA